jgi:hypothetical protein
MVITRGADCTIEFVLRLLARPSKGRISGAEQEDFLMSIPLQEALKQVELRAGETYRCQVNGYHVEVRVTAAQEAEPESRIPESDIMLEAWTELPKPTGGVIVKSRPGIPRLPDPIDIPEDDEAI